MPLYDIINWQKNSKGAIQFQIVGNFDGSLKIDERSIRWAGGRVEVSLHHHDKRLLIFYLLVFTRLLILLYIVYRSLFLCAPLLALLEHDRPVDQGSLSAALTVCLVLKGNSATSQVKNMINQLFLLFIYGLFVLGNLVIPFYIYQVLLSV